MGRTSGRFDVICRARVGVGSFLLAALTGARMMMPRDLSRRVSSKAGVVQSAEVLDKSGQYIRVDW